ncbi:hypothetical protein F4604DRAFT_1829730 [Suillus subluteus]|nr:hypothetical protein F4604DRAFT_1829730 [Suillus subluteus]
MKGGTGTRLLLLSSAANALPIVNRVPILSLLLVVSLSRLHRPQGFFSKSEWYENPLHQSMAFCCSFSKLNLRRFPETATDGSHLLFRYSAIARTQPLAVARG